MKRLALILTLAAVVAWVVRPAAMIPEQVRIDTGTVEGVTGTVKPTVRIYKGIPFAAPPTGENRWKAPQPAAKWDGVFKANAFGPSCIAGAPGGGRGGGRGAAPGRGGAPGAPAAAAPQAQAPATPPPAPRQPPASEDCLTVNVWTSADRANDRRPVMVWIYGGGFTGGSGGMAWYDGEDLAAKGPVIVTLNYRLGGFGFFAHPELAKESGRNAAGNYGMMDAIAALQWVKRNISNFGGDPNNVTIFGESAGAIMIGALVGSPVAKGLFNRAILESGSYMGLQMARMNPGATAQANGVKALQAAGVNSIAELRAKPLAEMPNLGGAGLIVDGYVIPEDLSLTFAAGRQNDVDILAGSNKDENTFFGGGGRGGGRGGAPAGGAAPAPGAAVEAYVAQAKQRYGDLADQYLKLYPAATDADVPLMNAAAQNDEIAWNMRQTAAAQAKKGKKAYAYFFTRAPLRDGKPQPNGATHTAEISYVFNHPYSNGTLEWNDVDRKLADQMSSYWVNFATKGDPNGSGLPKWPEYKNLATDRVMVLGDTVQVEAAPMAAKNAFFSARYQRLMTAQPAAGSQ